MPIFAFANAGVAIDTSAWPTPPLFSWLIEAASLDRVQAHRIFNCGVGMVAVVAPARIVTVPESVV